MTPSAGRAADVQRAVRGHGAVVDVDAQVEARVADDTQAIDHRVEVDAEFRAGERRVHGLVVSAGSADSVDFSVAMPLVRSIV